MIIQEEIEPTHCTIYTWYGIFLARVEKDEDGIFVGVEALVDDEWVIINDYFADSAIRFEDYRVMSE